MAIHGMQCSWSYSVVVWQAPARPHLIETQHALLQSNANTTRAATQRLCGVARGRPADINKTHKTPAK